MIMIVDVDYEVVGVLSSNNLFDLLLEDWNGGVDEVLIEVVFVLGEIVLIVFEDEVLDFVYLE